MFLPLFFLAINYIHSEVWGCGEILLIEGKLTIPFLCYYKKFKGTISLFGYYHMPNIYLVRDWSMTHAKISSGVQHRVYILHVLRIKDKQKKLCSKCYEKLSTWLKCHNFFATPWKFLILSHMYRGQTKRFKKWKKPTLCFAIYC